MVRSRTGAVIAAWLAVVAVLWAGGAAPAARAAARAVLPLAGPVARGFDPPGQPWLPGHRGVDLLGAAGTEVVAAMAGRVVFAGTVAGREVVVVSHGELRTTYLPVRPLVGVGTAVVAGEVIGRLQAGHACPGGSCLHWGLKRGDTYLDPLSLLDATEVRLLPAGAAARVADLVDYRDRAIGGTGAVVGVLGRPVPGGVGSPFGMRLHPIFHEWRLHNGVDLHAGCGDPIRAAAPGRVARVSYDPASGHRLEIDHGSAGGHHLVTMYLHATGYRVRAGQHVRGGEVVGTVGSTGWSTGCHLHFIVMVDGRYVDPERFV
jgi:murein DD-endopeptidase MepM/ murein hydrolase activator NlpD